MKFRKRILPAFAGVIALSALLSSFATRAEPVEYVRVCDVYGTGFFYIPGTETCIRVGGYVQAGYGWGQSDYRVDPSFSYNNNGGVYGGGGQLMFRGPNSPFVYGVEFNWNGSSVNGDSVYSGNGLRHETKLQQDIAVEFFAGGNIAHEMKFGRGYSAPATVAVTAGPIWGRSKVGAEGMPTSAVWQTGYTVGLLIDQPIDKYWSAGVKVQYIDYGRDRFDLGGPVDVKNDEWRAMLRIQRNFAP